MADTEGGNLGSLFVYVSCRLLDENGYKNEILYQTKCVIQSFSRKAVMPVVWWNNISDLGDK